MLLYTLSQKKVIIWSNFTLEKLTILCKNYKMKFCENICYIILHICMKLCNNVI